MAEDLTTETIKPSGSKGYTGKISDAVGFQVAADNFFKNAPAPGTWEQGSALLPGNNVDARGLSWEVVESEGAGEQTRLRLRCLEGDLRGDEIDILTPLEQVTLRRRDLAPEKAGRLADWRLYHQAYLLEQELGPRSLVAAEPGRLDPQPYQVVPVMRPAMLLLPQSLLVGDVLQRQ